MLTPEENKSYEYCDILYSGTIDSRLETEYFLPDYCPDIFKILSCQIWPRIDSYSLNENCVNCDGFADIYISYIDENAAVIRCCELTMDFSCSKSQINGNDNCLVVLEPSVNSTVCKAMGSRKISIQSHIELNCTVYNHNISLISAPGDDMETKKVEIEADEAIGELCKEVSINEILELPEACPPVESVIGKSIYIKDCKTELSEGGIELSGKIDLKIVYRPYSEKKIIETASFQIPFSEKIEADVPSDSIVNVNYICDDLMTQKKEDNMGEYNSFDVFIKLLANIFIIRKKELSLITDMYSTEYDSKFENTEQMYYHYPSYTVKETIKDKLIPVTDLETILDIKTDNLNCTSFIQNGNMGFRGKYTVTILYTDTSKRINCAKKDFDYSIVTEIESPARRRCSCKALLSVSDFKICDSGNVCLSLSFTVDCRCIDQESFQCPKLQEQGNKLTNKSNIVIYYPSGEESLWSVCKKYHVPESRILIENNNIDGTSVTHPLIIY